MSETTRRLDYEMPASAVEERGVTRDNWRAERALLLRNLLACVGIEQQAEGMDFLIQLEHVHVTYTNALQAAWYRSVQSAYLEGVHGAISEADPPAPSEPSSVH